jgi:hypothetical protein
MATVEVVWISAASSVAIGGDALDTVTSSVTTPILSVKSLRTVWLNYQHVGMHGLPEARGFDRNGIRANPDIGERVVASAWPL